MQVVCRSNLDLRGELWPNELPCLPHVGDHIESRTEHNGFRLELAVVRITFRVESKIEDTFRQYKYVPEIELHFTSFHKMLPTKKEGAEPGSMWAFYEWYAPRVGTSVHAFL